jgi:Cation efflux family
MVTTQSSCCGSNLSCGDDQKNANICNSNRRVSDCCSADSASSTTTASAPCAVPLHLSDSQTDATLKSTHALKNEHEQSYTSDIALRSLWMKRALYLAIFTIIYNLVEGVVSIVFGADGESIALLGFGIDSFVEVGSAFLVLWRFRHDIREQYQNVSDKSHSHTDTDTTDGELATLRLTDESAVESDQHQDQMLVVEDHSNIIAIADSESDSITQAGRMSELERERRATLFIGVLLVALGLSASGAGLHQLITKSHPETTSAGVIISGISLGFMFFLWYTKLRAALILDSVTMEKDASCSLGCIQLSCILFIGSILFWLEPRLWWADPAAAVIMGLMIGQEGVESVKSARSANFDGGCGCCSTGGPLQTALRKLFGLMPTESSSDSSSMTCGSDMLQSAKNNHCSGGGCCGSDSSKDEVCVVKKQCQSSCTNSDVTANAVDDDCCANAT